MSGKKNPGFSRREREIMDALFRIGEGGVRDVASCLDDHAAYDSLRVTLSILERKGFVRHRRDGKRYIFEPTIPREEARASALTHFVDTFFDGSPARAILAILDMSEQDISDAALDELQGFLARAGAPAE